MFVEKNDPYIYVCIIEYSTLTVIVSEKGRKSQQEDEARENKKGSETSPNLGTVEIDRRKNRGGCNIYETGMRGGGCTNKDISIYEGETRGEGERRRWVRFSGMCLCASEHERQVVVIIWVVWGVRLMVRDVGENERRRTWEKTEKLLNRESSLRNRGARRNAPPASTDSERTKTLRTITRKTTPINMSNSPPTLSHEPLLRGESPQQTSKRRRRSLRLIPCSVLHGTHRPLVQIVPRSHIH